MSHHYQYTNNILLIIENISNIYLENKSLKEMYDELFSQYIYNAKKRAYENKQKQDELKKSKKPTEEPKEDPKENDYKPNFFEIPKKNDKKETDKKIKHDELIKQEFQKEKDDTEDGKELKTKDANDADIDKSNKNNKQKFNTSDYDNFQYYEPNDKQQSYNDDNEFDVNKRFKKNVLYRKKASKFLKKILKKIFKRIIIKLHPDRCSLKNAEKLCRDLMKSYKKNDYAVMFYLFKLLDCKITLKKKEIESLTHFLFDELDRLKVTNKVLKKSIKKLR